MKALRHIIIIPVAAFLILGIPFLRTDFFAGLVSGNSDAVSSATVVLDQPSGEYEIFINQAKHPDQEALNTWIDFFSGKEISFLFEDITCAVPMGDVQGLEMAKSLQSQLPENQMSVVETEGTLLFSKAEYGKFDILLVSKEMAQLHGAGSLSKQPDVVTVYLKGNKV